MTHTTQSPSSSLLLNGTADDTLREVLSIMLHLKEIYIAEQSAMKANKIKDFIALQPTRDNMMRDLEIGIKAVKAKGDGIKSASIDLRQKLIDLQAEIDTLAEQSMNWSLRMVESIRRVQDRLIAAARASMQDDLNLYSRKGAMKQSTPRAQATAINGLF